MPAKPAAKPVPAPKKEVADTDAELGELPPVADDLIGWRKSVAVSINDTRDELRAAHSSVTRLRKQLKEVDSRRNASLKKIAASLSRAENLLNEIRNAWR
ncbi:MAG: hypothetical protein AAGA09_06380 [Pseudomonadota bacterium]